MAVHQVIVNDIIQDEMALTPELASKLAIALGTTPDFWLKFHNIVVDLEEDNFNFGEALLDGIKEIIAIEKGELNPSRATDIKTLEEGFIRKALCDKHGVVDAVMTIRDVPLREHPSIIVEGALISVCPECGETLSVPHQEQPKFAEAYKKARN